MKHKVEDKLNKIPGIKSIEETHLTERNGKWLLLTTKVNKENVKREVEEILHGLKLKLMNPGLTQPEILSKA